jgi:hypothetical protein
VSSSGSRFEIIDRNIIGSGHELNTKFRNRFSDGKNAYGVGYTILILKIHSLKLQ